ncbi:MAG: hypothetical protein A3J65_04395 [Candidatus Buchananbacteria bacterium RIFCSPHIGHO2_02_FULL_45_11b]|uniref:Glycosyl transferase family 1 domain-containing protein n=1 Tax=Candidatus Buchananbacteria bacterium RIFCSPHIGHO2_02_FULL_45_11b TaxID=1797541 RepID=A0A1G1YD21_9BACT|nr:MAG: hypothetical protein A3J65_04395 [Candidatus Buchananbacteria bacterium RIFCSPHIGHO2_02_FULL_45_11b]
MKKILIVVDSIIDNGLGRYTKELIFRLRPHYQISILTSNPGSVDWRELNIPVFLLPPMKKLNNPFINFFQSIKYLSLAKKADFIHYCSEFPHCFLFLLIPFLNKPRFITAHGTYAVAPLDHFFYKYLLRFAFKKADKIFCVSNFTAQKILRRIKLDNIAVINNGVDFNKFYRPFVSPGQNKDKVILSVGLIKNRKGFDISIQAAAKIKSVFPDLKYYIVGDQSDSTYFNYLKQLVISNNLEKNIIFLENVSDEKLIDLYCQSDVFILTPVVIKNNKFEGFGLVYLEAGACGKPVIGTLGCGAEDAIKDGYNGLLVKQNDISETAEALKKILTDPKLAENLGRNGQTFARQMDWSNIIKKYQAAYESRLAEKNQC